MKYNVDRLRELAVKPSEKDIREVEYRMAHREELLRKGHEELERRRMEKERPEDHPNSAN